MFTGISVHVKCKINIALFNDQDVFDIDKLLFA